jgi:hypothetical protein
LKGAKIVSRETKQAIFHKALFIANGETLVTEQLTQDYSSRQENTQAHVWDLDVLGLSGSSVNNGESLLAPTRLTSKFLPISNPSEWWLHAVTQPAGRNSVELSFTTAAISPDGESFAIGGVDGTVRVYPATPQGLLGVATDLAQNVSKVDFC